MQDRKVGILTITNVLENILGKIKVLYLAGKGVKIIEEDEPNTCFSIVEINPLTEEAAKICADMRIPLVDDVLLVGFYDGTHIATCINKEEQKFLEENGFEFSFIDCD